jgi:hypothetical protein
MAVVNQTPRHHSRVSHGRFKIEVIVADTPS